MTRGYAAFLFDMDGTLITSTPAAERVWTRWAARHGLDAAAFVPTIHGVRAIDDPDLQQRLARELVPLTMCPLSNLELQVTPDLTQHLGIGAARRQPTRRFDR